MKREKDILNNCIGMLKKIMAGWLTEPIVVRPAKKGEVYDVEVRLTTQAMGLQRFVAQVRAGGDNIPQDLLPLIRNKYKGGDPFVLFLDYAPPRLQSEFREQRFNYIDTSGNAFLALDWAIIDIRGQKANKKISKFFDPILTTSALKLVHLFLVYPESIKMTQRQMATASGIAKGGVYRFIAALEKRGYLVNVGKNKLLVDKSKLYRHWETGYNEKLRNKMLIGRFSCKHRVDQLPSMLTAADIKFTDRPAQQYTFGGELAANVLIHGSIRPTTIALYFRGTNKHCQEFLKQNAMLPDKNGNIWLFDAYSPSCFWKHLDVEEDYGVGSLPLTTPLLIMAELNNIRDPRINDLRKTFFDNYINPLLEVNNADNLRSV